ncbi:unnamed protein product [Adineta steineri]|uniref:Uncharacterized protein n=1 Tax=Adineta steineri TaxID=433720 RepID=A0A814FFI1_9BILA|nr:unnamed protein product [Adineta steineri]CAF0979985.1 unnamed protein product [Adineta steineri]CAF1006415.1 unnamed protein product [Adineta steineri]CAF1438666.1 unnamed protein product [Adineta steineri]
MAKEESPIFQDISFNSTAIKLENNENSLLSIDITDIDIPSDLNHIFPSFDLFSEEKETISFDELLSSSSFDIPPSMSDLSSIYTDTKSQQYIVQVKSPPMDFKCQSDISLSFINPPEPYYHVRYLSEITNTPLNGNFVNTRIKTKKNVSGRYLKGMHGRYVTVALPSIFSDNSNLFIRVTRLTLPYQDISFIHPYPLLYSYPKKNNHPTDVIIQDSSIYFKINKEEVCSRSKRFPHLILTRLKQCQLKQMNNINSFDNNERSYAFIGNNAKNKIAIYQLKKSQLDFRLVIRSEQTGEFFNTNIFCRSNALLEEEGIEWKKSSI